MSNDHLWFIITHTEVNDEETELLNNKSSENSVVAAVLGPSSTYSSNSQPKKRQQNIIDFLPQKKVSVSSKTKTNRWTISSNDC